MGQRPGYPGSAHRSSLKGCFQAPTGRTNLAQANALGTPDRHRGQALKGRANPYRNLFPDSRFIIPTGRADRWIRRSPFQGSAAKNSVNPGRCPGLDWIAPSGLRQRSVPWGLPQIQRHGMAAAAVARLWLRLLRAVYTWIKDALEKTGPRYASPGAVIARAIRRDTLE
jgi:hypothetical protein